VLIVVGVGAVLEIVGVGVGVGLGVGVVGRVGAVVGVVGALEKKLTGKMKLTSVEAPPKLPMTAAGTRTPNQYSLSFASMDLH